MAIFSKKCANTSRNHLTEQGMGVGKRSENSKFPWLHSYIFILKILLFQIVNLGYCKPIEEFPVVSFFESRALIPTKYMAEKSVRILEFIRNI